MNKNEFNTFPVCALPARIRYAAIEIQKNIKSPLPINAPSTSGSVAPSIETLIDIRLPHGPVIPAGLFMTRAVMLHETPSAQSSCAASVSWKG